MNSIVSMTAMLTLVWGVALGAAAPTRAAGASTPGASTPTPAPSKWVEGRNYFPIVPARPTGLPAGKVQVTEVFSYACPACNQFQPYMRKLEHGVPANVVIGFVPASFNPAEDWPMFQLAYVTAQSLGIADKTHDAMYEAVWTTRELATMDSSTGGLKSHMPTIEDAARFYEKHAGVPVAKFLAASKSFAVDNQVRVDEEAIRQFGVDRTPTIVVNGKYRVQVDSAGGPEGLIELVNWLAAKESK